MHTDVEPPLWRVRRGPAASKTDRVHIYDGNMVGAQLEVPFIKLLFVYKLYRWVI